MLYIGVKEWICIHKNCCHDESNDLREDKLICLLTEMEFHTFQDHPVLNYHTWAMVMGPLHTQGLDFIGTLHLVNGRLYCFCAKDKEVLIGDYCSSRTYCRCEDIGNGFVPCPVLEINVLIFTEGQLISS